MPDNRRLLELALKGLQLERGRIDEEIADIRQRLNGLERPVPAQPQTSRAVSRQRTARGARKSRLTEAGRRALSEAMRRRWARKKAAGKAAK